MLLKWPEKAINAIQKLFEELQDIDVYIEDIGLESLYAELIKRIASKNVRLARVFAVGGRLEVIERARHHDFSLRCALFIVDGDFEWVRGEDPPSIDGVYRLDAYCIENLLITKSAAIRILMECTESDTQSAEQNLRFDEWTAEVSLLVKLFEIWAVVNKIVPTVATVSQGVGKVLDNTAKVAKVEKSKVYGLIEEARIILDEAENSSLESLRQDVQERISNIERKLDVISGKHFLLPLLRFHLNVHSKAVPSNSQLRFRLAMNPCSSRFRDLAEAIEKASRGKVFRSS
jgi:hypothetical protein